MDSKALKATIAGRIQRGEAPRGKATRTWGGISDGKTCAACGQSIRGGKPEIEAAVNPGGGRNLFFHPLCFNIWRDAVSKAL